MCYGFQENRDEDSRDFQISSVFTAILYYSEEEITQLPYTIMSENFSALDALQHRVYERTDNLFDISPSPDDSQSITKTDIFGDGTAVVLHNFITPTEIDQIIRQSTTFGLSDSRYPSSYRICERVSAQAGLFKMALFERLAPFLSDILVQNEFREKGIPDNVCEGTWHPYALNPTFRVVKYSPGGFFYPHYDGGFQISRTNTSIKTLMIYLNDGFEGGTTNFYEDFGSIKPYEKPDSSLAIHQYTPKAGDCLIFNHAMLHDGGKLEGGEKWICRSEVMYEKF